MYNLPVAQHPTEKFATLREGAATGRLIAIRYRDKNFEVSERIIEPYEIKDGKLFAYCLKKKGIRAFFLNNILAAAPTKRTFDARFPIQTLSFQNINPNSR